MLPLFFACYLDSNQDFTTQYRNQTKPIPIAIRVSTPLATVTKARKPAINPMIAKATKT